MGRGDESADIDLRTLAEQHTRGVDDEDLAVGVDRAVDHAGLVADNAVQCHRRCARLIEVHALVRTDREALPVDDALFVDWLILVAGPAWEIVAAPSTTVPPLGPAQSGDGSKRRAAIAVDANSACLRRHVPAEKSNETLASSHP